MRSDNLFLNGVFYTILTFFFIFVLIYAFLKESKINRNIDRFVDFLLSKIKIRNKSRSLRYYFEIVVEVLGITTLALVLALIIQIFYIGHYKVPTSEMSPVVISKDRLFANKIVYKFKKPKRGDVVVFREPIKDKDLYIKRVMGLPGEKVYIKNRMLYVNDEPIVDMKYRNLGEIRNTTWVVPKKGDIIHVIPGRNYKKYYKSFGIDVNEMQNFLRKDTIAINQLMPDLLFRVNGKETGKILDVIHNRKYLNKLMAGEIVEIKLEQNYYLTLSDNFDSRFDSRMWGFVGEDKIYGKVFLRFWPLKRFGIVK